MTTANNSNNKIFFLGGADAEMMTIREVLSSQGVQFCDKGLGWGASVSAYQAEIAEAQSNDLTVVTIELVNDLGLQGLTEVDHHGDRASEPAAILQVLALLGLEPTRWQLLVAANDSGYIPAMLQMGATAEEVAAVRLLDRSAQGITVEMENEAERAISNREVVNGVTIVKMAHSKCATVTDRLFSLTEKQNLLILSEDGESNYYGDGELCSLLRGKETGTAPAPWDANQTITTYSNFGGWNGGSGLGVKGGSAFWGGDADQNVIKDFVLDFFS